jgi:hypothetical protein
MNPEPWSRRRALTAGVAVIACPAVATAETGSFPPAALIRALQRGGYVVLMRHASSPDAPPAPADAEPDNTGDERQLDAAGRAAATAMGAALKALRIPAGEVLSSPTYRALQTARLAGLPVPQTFPELGDAGRSMQALPQSQAAWLRTKTAERPRPGTDTFIVTQYPNIQGAYGPAAAGLADGEAMVFRPDGKGGATLVGRIRMQDWPRLASR